MSSHLITFLCSGNICRSPMAAALAAMMLEARGVEADVLSAGTYGIESHAAAWQAIDVMAEIGLDLSGHRSRGISARLMRRSTSIVVLAPEHEEVIVSRFPDLASRVHRLWEYTDRPGRLTSIVDPNGGTLEEFAACRDDLVECVRNLIDTVFPGARPETS